MRLGSAEGLLFLLLPDPYWWGSVSCDRSMFLHGRALLTYEYSTFIIPPIRSMYTSYCLVVILLFRKETRLWYTLFKIAVDMHGNCCNIKKAKVEDKRVSCKIKRTVA